MVKTMYGNPQTAWPVNFSCVKKKSRVTLFRQPGYLELLKTRGFPSPAHTGFGF
jgi:hypothetical protein